MMKSTFFLIQFLLMCLVVKAQSNLESAYADYRAAAALQPQAVVAGFGKHYAIEQFKDLKIASSTLISALEQEKTSVKSEKNRLESENNRLKADIQTLKNQNSIEYVTTNNSEPVAVQPQRRTTVTEPTAYSPVTETTTKAGGFNEWISNNFLILLLLGGMGYFFYNQHLQKKQEGK